MIEIDILHDLFDEKVINVINTLLENSEKKLTLTEISNTSKVNITTTFRIVNRLITRDFVSSSFIGKTKLYQLKKNEKSMILYKFLKKQGNYLEDFLDRLKQHPRLKKIILEGRSKNEAKLIIVGDFLPSDKLKVMAEDIFVKYNFKINFLLIDEKQFEDMKKLGLYDLANKLLWEKKAAH